MEKKVLQSKSKFYTKASYLLSRGMPVEDLYSLIDDYEITKEQIDAYIKNKTKSTAISGAIMASKEEKELLYNQLDQKFIDQFENVVIFYLGENAQFYEYRDGVYVPLYDTDMQNNVDTLMAEYSLFEYRANRRKVKDTVERIISLLSRTPHRHFFDDEIIHQKFFLNLKNGLLDLTDFTLHPHTKEYFSTVQVSYDYNPLEEAPIFAEFIKVVSNQNEEIAQMIQEMFGYCISHGNPKHKVFYLYGNTARNGKSCTAKLLCGLLGWGNISALTLGQIASENSSILTSLVGKQLNFSDEISSKFIMSPTLTTMSSEGKVEINPKYKKAFLYTIKAKFIVACNDMPQFKDNQGMKNRTICIPFRYQIPESDRIDNYDEILLKKEGPGILNWAIEGAKLLKKNGLFLISEDSLEDVEESNMANNPVYAFLEDMYDFSSDHKERVHYMDIYGKVGDRNTDPTGFRKYCHDHGILPRSANSFSKELKRFASETKKIIYKKDDNIRFYTGLKLKEFVEDEPFKDTSFEEDEMTQSALLNLEN